MGEPGRHRHPDRTSLQSEVGKECFSAGSGKDLGVEREPSKTRPWALLNAVSPRPCLPPTSHPSTAAPGPSRGGRLPITVRSRCLPRVCSHPGIEWGPVEAVGSPPMASLGCCGETEQMLERAAVEWPAHGVGRDLTSGSSGQGGRECSVPSATRANRYPGISAWEPPGSGVDASPSTGCHLFIPCTRHPKIII